MNSSQIHVTLSRLEQSKFRSQFHLQQKEKDYIFEKGIGTIRQHAYDFVKKRLAPATLINDGKQTPMRGHPVFIAQHATATCCRKCLYKWHHIKPNQELTSQQIDYIVDIIMEWIQRERGNEKNDESDLSY